MPKRQRTAELPREVIPITRYSQLDLYLGKFAAGELGLVLLLGRHGTGKSEGVRRALNISSSDGYAPAEGGPQVLYVEGHMKPYGLYCSLWEYRDHVVVLDDLDKLYADADCVRILKPLCNTERSNPTFARFEKMTGGIRVGGYGNSDGGGQTPVVQTYPLEY